MGYRVVVELDRCESNALCTAFAPEVFQLDDADVLRLVDDRPGDERRADVDTAVAHCPRQAITLVEE